MAVTNMDTLVAALVAQERKGFSKGSFTPAASGSWHSLWTIAGQPGAGAAQGSVNGAIPDDATTGAHPFVNASGAGNNYLGYVACTGLAVGTLVIYDRLWHDSGLNTNTTITNITQPALTRSTDGKGVELWAEWYVASGAATATNATISYTDQDGNTGNTGTIVMPARTKAIADMFPMTMAAGDYGVRAVASCQLSTTQTSGTWGLTLMKRLGEIPIRPSDQGASVLNAIDLGLPEIPDDACLAFMFQGANTANTLAGTLSIAKG
jgi:hypothetical protein